MKKVLWVILLIVVVLTFGFLFASAEEAEFVIEDHVLIAYNGPGGDVMIPENLGITSIGYRAFGWGQCEHYKDIISVTFCEGIERVEAEAFNNCRNLERVVLPKSICYLGSKAFLYCNSLREIENAEYVTAVCYDYNGSSSDTFSGCTALEDSDKIGIWHLYWHSWDRTHTLVGYGGPGGELVVPSDLAITSIDDSWCSNKDMRDSITGITLPKGVERIYEGAFRDFGSLTHVDMPETITYIGGGAFRNCPLLRSLVLPDSITHFGNGNQASDDGSQPFDVDIVLDVGYNSYAMRYCVANHLNFRVISGQDAPEYVVSDGALTAYNGLGGDVIIPDSLGLTAIGEGVFRLRSDIRSVTLPEGIISIGANAFRDCYRMKEAHLPDTLTSLGSSAFSGCRGLSALAIPRNLEILSFDHGDEYGYVDFCDSDMPLAIYKNSKAYASVLTYIYGVENPFRLIDSEDEFIIRDNVLVKYTGGSTSVVIPGSVAEIGTRAFYFEKRLVKVEIQKGVEKIGESAFEECAALSSVEFPQSLKEIGRSAFEKCTSLTSITIPAGVERIGSQAFDECFCIEEVILNEGLTTIDGDYAFYCRSLKRVRIPESLMECDLDDTFYEDTLLEVYAGTVMAEQCLSNNLNYEIIGSAEPQEPPVSDEAFIVEDGRLTAYRGPGGSVRIPEDLDIDSIEYRAFSGRSNVTEITLSSTIHYIDNYAFDGARGLQAVYVAEDNRYYQSIDGVLYNNTGTELVFYPQARQGTYTIPEGTVSLRSTCFLDSNVTEITLASTVETENVYLVLSCASRLQAIHVAEGNPFYQSIDGVLFDAAGTTLLCYPRARQGAYTVPESTITLDYSCFDNCIGPSSLILSGSVADRLFYFPEYDEVSFFRIRDCETLASIAITSESQYFQTQDGMLLSRDGRKLYWVSNNIGGTLTIPEGVVELDYLDLSWNCPIETVVIPASLTDGEEIENVNNRKLKTIFVAPKNPKYCSIDGVLYSKDGKTLLLCPKAYEGRHEIPEGTRTIGARAFDYCKKITGIVIPKTVTTIESAAFQSCDRLTDIVIPMSVRSMGSYIFAYHDADNYAPWYGGPVGVYAGSVAEAYCAAQNIGYYIVEEAIPETGVVVLPRSLTTIESEAFAGIASNYIEIPNTVTSIARDAFKPGTRLIVIQDSFADNWAKAHGFVTMYR